MIETNLPRPSLPAYGTFLRVLAIISSFAVPSYAWGLTIFLSGPSGLTAEAEFNLPNATTLTVRLKNTSTGVPIGFTSADQLLTGVSFDFAGATSITGGSVVTGPSSASLNFSIANVSANADVSGEYGFGNGGTTGFLPNFFSGNQAGATQFAGPNLDATTGINGPQAGLVANPIVVPLGGLGAIQDEIVATLNLSQAIQDLSFLDNGVIAEFGSDAAFITPEPMLSCWILVLGAFQRTARRLQNGHCRAAVC